MAMQKIGDFWNLNSVPATATQATASRAVAATAKHVAKRVIAGIAAGATASVAVVLNLRDGATGAGSIMCSWVVACIVNGMSPIIDSDNLHFQAAAVNVQMTIEFAAAGAATTQEVCSLQGYDL